MKAAQSSLTIYINDRVRRLLPVDQMIRDAATWTFVRAVTRPALALASPEFLADIAGQLEAAGIQYAVANHESTPIIDWCLRLLSLQGISDQAAFAFDHKHGGIRSAEIERKLRHRPACQRLQSYWSFEDCSYRKTTRTCSEPALLPGCPLPGHNLRKGGLNVASYGLHLFMRDVCSGDFIAWFDGRLLEADPGKEKPDRAARMRDALIAPLSCIPNTGPKLWSMILADLLLAADPARERWVATGAAMVAIDSLVHNFLHRTGSLRHFSAEHAYGPACYQANGCAEIVEVLAEHIDASKFNPSFPAIFPRFVQHSLWSFCATGQGDICNGTRINDRDRCQQVTCPAFAACDRVSLA